MSHFWRNLRADWQAMLGVSSATAAASAACCCKHLANRAEKIGVGWLYVGDV